MNRNIIILLLSGLFFTTCKEEGRLDHIDDLAPAPLPVTVSEVINRPGGAVIRYKIPKDRNLAGVKALYYRGDELCESKASLYVDSLIVEGFGNTNPRDIQIYSIGWNEKSSEPVTVQVNPLMPPILAAIKELGPTFGGVEIRFLNQARANLTMVLLIDSTGNNLWEPLQTFYTKADTGSFFRRGLKDKEQKFAMYFRDRWNNKSDTIVRALTPIKEELLPKSNFLNRKLPGDTWEPAESAYPLDRMWDGIVNLRTNIFASKNTEAPMPQHFTISLGFKAAINRFKIHQRADFAYIGTTARTFELWGSDNPPADGSWNNWYLLGEFEAFKPSGYASDGSAGTVTAEDKHYACVEGIDCELLVTDKTPNPYMPVTHIRFKTKSTYETHGTVKKTGQVTISELTFWGLIEK